MTPQYGLNYLFQPCQNHFVSTVVQSTSRSTFIRLDTSPSPLEPGPKSSLAVNVRSAASFETPYHYTHTNPPSLRQSNSSTGRAGAAAPATTNTMASDGKRIQMSPIFKPMRRKQGRMIDICSLCLGIRGKGTTKSDLRFSFVPWSLVLSSGEL